MKILTILVLMLLPMGANAQKYGKDNFRFLEKEYENLTPA